MDGTNIDPYWSPLPPSPSLASAKVSSQGSNNLFSKIIFLMMFYDFMKKDRQIINKSFNKSLIYIYIYVYLHNYDYHTFEKNNWYCIGCESKRLCFQVALFGLKLA